MSDGRETPYRVPDRASEARLAELRKEAEQRGSVSAPGIRPPGAPFPVASPEAGYYGIPLLKPPQWTWEIPVYFFAGGTAGAAAAIAAAAETAGDKHLARHARLLAAAGGIISPLLLTGDLGRPERFLFMLRVFKPQSPMSVGAWLVLGFSKTSVIAALADLLEKRLGEGFFPAAMRSARLGAAATGLAMSTYPGVLIGATVIPVWNRNVRTLPVHFAASAMASAVSALELAGHDRSRALNALGVGAAAIETIEGATIELNRGPVMRPLMRGSSGWLTRAGGVLSGPVPLALRLAAGFADGRKSRQLRRAAAVSSLAGSFITRLAWLRAGRESARDYRLPLEIEDNGAKELPGGITS